MPNGNDTEKLIETSGDQKDIVKQFITTMKTGKAFFVDANGREYIKRVSDVMPIGESASRKGVL